MEIELNLEAEPAPARGDNNQFKNSIKPKQNELAWVF